MEYFLNCVWEGNDRGREGWREGGWGGDMMFIDLINIILLHSFYIYIMVYTISVIDVLIYINFKKKKI